MTRLARPTTAAARTDQARAAAVARRPILAVGVVTTLAGLGLGGWGLAAPGSGAAGKGTPQVVPEMPVTAMHQRLGLANNSPEVAADPTDDRFVVIANRFDAPDFSCALQVSGNAGRTWLPARPVPELPDGADKCYAPEVSFDRNGRLYYLFPGLHGGGNEPMGVFLTTSDDRARTFTPPRQVLEERNFSVRMAINDTVGEPGRIHLAWLRATSDPPLGGLGPPPNPIMAAYSDDGGDTWSEPVQINGPDRPLGVAPALEVGPDGTVYLAYYDLKKDQRDYRGLAGPVYDGTWSLLLARSTDGGQTFTTTVVDEGLRPTERVMLIFTMPQPALTSGADGRVCLAWPDARQGDADVLARCSPDRGETWNGPTRVNDDPQGNGATQRLPQIDLAPNGRLDVIFFDRRQDPADRLQHVYYASSDDGGRRFSANVRVTSRSFDSEIGQEYVSKAAEGLTEFGSRLGLLAEEDLALAVWPDTRNSWSISEGQDLFATSIHHPDPPSGAITAWVGGLGLVLVGLALTVLGIRRRGPPGGPPGRGGGGLPADPEADGSSPGAPDVGAPQEAPRVGEVR